MLVSMEEKKTIVGLLGYPVEHSLSPAMHNAAFQYCKMNWEYRLFSRTKDELKDFIKEVKDNNYRGFNVTIPYKQEIMKYLDQLRPAAKRIGAVNTVINNSGRLEGTNTDYIGFGIDLKNKLDFDPGQDKKVLLLGAGGAARAVVEELTDKFYSEGETFQAMNEWKKKPKWSGEQPDIYIYDIDQDKADKIIKDFGEKSVEIIFTKKEEITDKLKDADLLVNAAPVGMKEGDSIVFSLKGKEYKKTLKIYDLVYNRKTDLIIEAEESGLKASGGIGMLLEQGAKAWEIWTGERAPREVMEKALKEKLNIKE